MPLLRSRSQTVLPFYPSIERWLGVYLCVESLNNEHLQPKLQMCPLTRSTIRRPCSTMSPTEMMTTKERASGELAARRGAPWMCTSGTSREREGEGKDEGSFLPGWRIAFIITGPCRVKREGARARLPEHVWVLIIQQMGDWKRVSNTIHIEEVLEVEWEILQVRYQVAIVANGLLGGGLHASGDEDGPTASSFCIKRD